MHRDSELQTKNFPVTRERGDAGCRDHTDLCTAQRLAERALVYTRAPRGAAGQPLGWGGVPHAVTARGRTRVAGGARKKSTEREAAQRARIGGWHSCSAVRTAGQQRGGGRRRGGVPVVFYADAATATQQQREEAR